MCQSSEEEMGLANIWTYYNRCAGAADTSEGEHEVQRGDSEEEAGYHDNHGGMDDAG